MDQPVRIEIPDQVNYILKKLNSAGYEAFAVGGCVRDAMLGRVPSDWDITTSALPAEIKKIFRKTVDTGIKHGTVSVLSREGACEVTTYRIDGIYEDGRHPKEVSFTSDLREDLRRRDFTVNAMAYHPVTGLVDIFGGLRDLEGKLIRAVGTPDERFEEDALRIMRAVRFSAQLDFSIEEATRASITRFAPRLEMVSRERIQTELVKLLVSPNPERFEILTSTGITTVILTSLEDNIRADCIDMLKRVPADNILRLAALFSKCSPEAVEKWLRDNKFDNDTIDLTGKLVKNIDLPFGRDAYGIRKTAGRIGTELFEKLLILIEARGTDTDTDKLRSIFDKTCRDCDCISLKQLAVTGSDLIEAGVKPGPGMGAILNDMLETVLHDPSKNDKELLMKLL